MSTDPSATGVPVEKSRWDSVKAWGSKTAKSASSQASKTYVKAKGATAAKMGVEPTPEEPDTLRAIERLKQTKLEVTELAKAARGMLEGARAHARHCLGFATAASTVRVDRGDTFAFMTRQMGQGFQFIDSSLQENLALLSEKVVAPMEKFLYEDIEAVNKLKWEYTAFKNTYDSAVHKAKKAKETASTTPEKQADLDGKATAKKMELDVLRSGLIAQVNCLELAKQRVLYMNMEAFWTRYVELHSHMSTTLAAVKTKEVGAEMMYDLHSQNPPEIVPAVGVLPPPVPPPAAAETLDYPAFEEGIDK